MRQGFGKGPQRWRTTIARWTAVILTPPAYHWILRHEAFIRRQGRPLSRPERAATRDIGLLDAGRVRILAVARIPLPADRLRKRIARFSRVVLADPVALTAGYGIYLCDGVQNDRAVLRHELVHVHQYERLGRRLFLRQYVRDCLAIGYLDAPLEKEARRLSVIGGRD